MIDLTHGAAFAAGILVMAIVHGIHVWLEARQEENEIFYFGTKPNIRDIMSEEDAEKWERAYDTH